MAIPLNLHLDALLLALASSMDNFTVGLSVGVGHRKMPLWVNCLISVANAFGALIAGFGGILIATNLPILAPLLAAFAFGYLGVQEFVSYCNSRHDRASTIQQLNVNDVIRLALPMTLNNLAGGVAGGAAGFSPWLTAAYALFASFLTMAVGHFLGMRIGKHLLVDPSLLSGILISILCFLTIKEALEMER